MGRWSIIKNDVLVSFFSKQDITVGERWGFSSSVYLQVTRTRGDSGEKQRGTRKGAGTGGWANDGLLPHLTFRRITCVGGDINTSIKNSVGKMYSYTCAWYGGVVGFISFHLYGIWYNLFLVELVGLL